MGNEDDSENRIIRIFLWLEGWGRLVRSQSLLTALRRQNLPCVVAWMAVLAVTVMVACFYIALNGTAAWVSFVAFFVLDSGVSYAGLAILLLSPVETALGRYHASQRDDDADSEAGQEVALLTSPRSLQSFRVARGDTAIVVHVAIGTFSVLSSCLSDDILEATQGRLSVPALLLFVLADSLEDLLYIVGFLLLAVAYRVIALRVWAEKHKLEHRVVDTRSAGVLLEQLGETRANYEDILADAEGLSAQTGVLGLFIILLAAIEMASSLDDVFSGEVKHWDGVHLAVLRLLLVLACCILQVTLAAADVHYASERLAKLLSIIAAEAQQNYAASTYGSVHDDAVAQSRVLAKTAQTLGARIRDFPIRMRVSWFHLTTEWAFGICALVFTILLAIVGIKLPGGE